MYQSLSLQLSDDFFNICLQVQRILKAQRESLFEVADISLGFLFTILRSQIIFQLSPKPINFCFIHEINFKGIIRSCPLCNTAYAALLEIQQTSKQKNPTTESKVSHAFADSSLFNSPIN